MGLSSFPSASEGLLPLVAANAALSVSATKSFLRCVRQLMGSPERALRGEERDGFSMSRFESSRSGHGGGTGECCAVCLCGFEEEEEVGELRCGHVFHVGCLMKWFDSRRHQQQQLRRTCPLCRSVL